MSAGTWTILGLGNFVWDVIDTIESRGGVVERVILNVEVDPGLVARLPDGVEIVGIDDFRPSSAHHCFGFTGPAIAGLLARVEPLGLDFASAIHATAYVARTARVGRGTFVGAGAVVAPHAVVGDFNHVNRQVSIGHDVTLGRFGRTGPGAIVSGLAAIGDRVYLGAGSVVRDRVRICHDVVVGAGAAVVGDLVEPGTYVGVPARKASEIPSG
jgi:sugar O-acyltransferase (sialic acid O-acetyltransferase NeuD family)